MRARASRWCWLAIFGTSTALAAGCGGDARIVPDASTITDGSTEDRAAADAGPDDDGGEPPSECAEEIAPIETGDPDGHADPYGARAAGQARAGRLRTEADLPAGFTPREEVGDVVLVNDLVGVVIEAPDDSDGYGPFGGEILSADVVGEDGRFVGGSRGGETIQGIGSRILRPTSVTVMNDGSSGEPAVVRVAGELDELPVLPFLTAILRGFDLPAAIDYTLAPGERHVTVTAHLLNDFPLPRRMQTAFGLLLRYRYRPFVPGLGFDEPASGTFDWFGFAGDGSTLVWSGATGQLTKILDESGVTIYAGPEIEAAACATTTIELARLDIGGPDAEGGLDALRLREGNTEAGRVVSGHVLDAEGYPVPGARVHVSDADGTWVTRALVGADGRWSARVEGAVSLVATASGYPDTEAVALGASATEAELAFAPTGLLHVRTLDGPSGDAMPARIQVIPVAGLPARPPSFGEQREAGGRLYQAYPADGDETLRVPVGEHDVIATHGFEREVARTRVMVTANTTAEVELTLVPSVESTGIQCADFHIHSHFSADSSDLVQLKVRSAAGDGLELPVSTEHESIVDFQPVVEALGLGRWTRGFAGSELTTFQWGHFGVFPLVPRPELPNFGVVRWYGRTPGEVFAEVLARPSEPMVIINHPRSGGALGGYFNAIGFDRVTGEVENPELGSDLWDVVEVFNDDDFEAARDSTVADWFSWLAHGRRVFAVGSSDSHHIRSSPVGYPRTCLDLGTDVPSEVTPGRLRDAARAGRSAVSGGILVSARTTAGEGPGSDVEVGAERASIRVTVQAPSWIEVNRLEVIVDGTTTETLALDEDDLPDPMRPALRFDADIEVPVADGAGSWVVFHAAGDEPLSPIYPDSGRRPFGVTNPIFLRR